MHLDVEEPLRRDAKRLIKMGVTQVAIAESMGRESSWLTKWLYQDHGTLTANNFRGFYKFVRDLARLAADIDAAHLKDERQESPPAAEPPSAKATRAR